ncbi:hypothetical protein FA15DRAFT_615354 [Coprinopsis marcescibilis]|uniref:Wbp11/ELF5/Saf1 N-terminal domain-containing protein n=1 Tax=Coprinopsis marcescibilis TaxID=230819 RepID=A0A5C3L182_COPMA|nr:hypothetical protein FA15DRAFT_615354 [Coprinopsis marcescibilis]
MAKKTANPADAHRKALRKKELKKNKTERAKARDFALVKKDTTELEAEIEKLEQESSGGSNARLSELKAELDKIQKKKEEYVEEHPEARKLVYRARRRDGAEDTESKPVQASRNMFNKKGLPRHPERSIYYDPVMNPFGVPPPGMSYMERPLRPDEVDSDAEMEDDDDIPLPPGLPPGSEEIGSDEDIPLPEGPPPGHINPVQSQPPSGMHPPNLPFPPPFPPNGFPSGLPPPPPPGFSGLPLPPPPPGIPLVGAPGFPPPPPPPPGIPVAGTANFPPPPPGAPPMGIGQQGWPSHFPMHSPPPPLGMPPYLPQHGQFPPPPPGFFPRKTQSPSTMQDPLSSVPYQTFQAHRASQLAPAHPSLPSKPAGAPLKPSAAVTASATVEAAPQLRDFKKEATAFVPASLKRKKPGATPSSGLNAAPTVGSEETPAGPSRPDLVSTLKNHLAFPKPEEKAKDDYAKFVEEMGDVL